MFMSFRGLNIDSARQLARLLSDASSTMEDVAEAVGEAAAVAEVAVEATGRLGAAAHWAAEQAAAIRRRVDTMDLDGPATIGLGVWSLGQRWDVECDDLETQIDERLKELKRRMDEAERDELDLRHTRPTGEFSYAGHLQQIRDTQRGLRKLLRSWDVNGCGSGGGGGTIPAGARAWASVDLVARLPKPITAPTPPPHHHSFSWGSALKAAGAVVGGATVVAGVVLAPEITIPVLATGAAAAA